MSPLGGWVYYILLSIPLLIGILICLLVVLGSGLIGMGAYRKYKFQPYTRYLVFGSILLGVAELIIWGLIRLALVG